MRAATEALYCNDEKDVVYLKKRTGFIRLALETGAALVPVFSFVCLLHCTEQHADGRCRTSATHTSCWASTIPLWTRLRRSSRSAIGDMMRGI